MIVQISLAVIAIALVALVSFLILVLLKFRKAISLIQADIHQLSIETAALIARFNELTTDIQRKSHSLNFLFAPLAYFNKEVQDALPKSGDIVNGVLNWISSGVKLLQKLKSGG
ncbi:MAG: DUF948 domain-containing protein [Rhabdochlamydiaceae bacterium]